MRDLGWVFFVLCSIVSFPVFADTRCGSGIPNSVDSLDAALISALPSECTALNPGETQTFYERRTALGSKYTLKRQADRVLDQDFEFMGPRVPAGTRVPVYTIVVNLSFNPKYGNRDQEIARITEKARACYAEASKKLRGPRGEYLEIALSADHPEIEAPGWHVVNVERGALSRLNDVTWGFGNTCPQIVHETLHVMGLVDEYPEPDAGFTCRKPGPLDSIMRNSNLPLNTNRPSLLFPGQFYYLVAPGCPTSSTYHQCAKVSQASECSSTPAACNSPDWVKAY